MSELWRHWYWQLSFFRLLWKSAWTPFVKEVLLCLVPKAPVFDFVPWALWFLFDSWGQELHPPMCLPDAVCSGAVENLPGFKAGITRSLIALVAGRMFWRLLNLSVLPSVGVGPCTGLHSFILCCHGTACAAGVVVVALLCRTREGWAEEVTSHSPALTCLNLMWFTSGFPTFGFRVDVHTVKDNCFKLKILTWSIFLCLVFTCFTNSLRF